MIGYSFELIDFRVTYDKLEIQDFELKEILKKKNGRKEEDRRRVDERIEAEWGRPQ